MKQIFIAGFLLLKITALAQTVTPSVMNSTGSAGNIGNIHFEISVGEGFTTTLQNSIILTQGLLQPLAQPVNSPLPVVGLDFFASRVNSKQVQLNWKTLQEINNKGFFIERKKENESSFQSMLFVKSKASNGNSAFPLSYAQLDTNSFAGKTYYRLRQEDIDGKFSYSLVRTVGGEAEKTLTLKAWPIPAPKEFTVSMTGATNDILLIFDAAGRLVRQLPIGEGQQVKVSGLTAGTYLLQLKNRPDMTPKITVQ